MDVRSCFVAQLNFRNENLPKTFTNHKVLLKQIKTMISDLDQITPTHSLLFDNEDNGNNEHDKGLFNWQ